MNHTSTLIIGTRGSDLALWQSHAVATMLRKHHPDLDVQLKVIETKGDQLLDVSLDKIGDKGLFTKELENALLKGEIDLAVHSLKDMQTRLPEGLTLGAITERANPEDGLVAKPGMTIETLPQGGTIATGSLRRRAQLLSLRPDLNVVDLRGNVPTRLRKYHESQWDGIILARAGLERLGLEKEIAWIIPPNVMLPAVGQGALGVEIRIDDGRIASLVSPLEHPNTRTTSEAERAFLRRLEGGCQAPIGAYATVNGDELHLEGLIASEDGARVLRRGMSGATTEAESLGRALAELLIDEGGEEMLREKEGL